MAPVLVQQPQDDIQLLASIIPKFLELARFYTEEDNEAAQKARARCPEPFYVKLHMELLQLDNLLAEWNFAISIPTETQDAITQALDILESRFVKGSVLTKGNFQKQTAHHILREFDRRINTRSEPLGLAQLRELMVLAAVGIKGEDRWRASYRRAILIERLKKLYHELDQLKESYFDPTITKRKTSNHGVRHFTAPEESMEIPETSHSTSTHVRNHAALLYELLDRTRNCQSQCRESHVAFNLRLATRRKNHPEARFRIQISHKSTTLTKWQESDIEFITKPQRAKPSQVKFRLPPVNLPVINPKSAERWPVESLCSLTHQLTSKPNCRLPLLVDDDQLFWSSPSFIDENIWTSNQVFLVDFLGLDTETPLSKFLKQDKLTLQLIIAKGFFNFYKSPQLFRNWSKTQICFYPCNNQQIPNLTEPYLSTSFDDNRDFDNGEGGKFQLHPYPGILTLGILLLEIELGQSIDSLRSIGTSDNGFHHVDLDWPIAQTMLRRCKGESPVDFIQAVEACLNPRTFINEFGNRCSFDNSLFRESIFTQIVKPLETALLKVFGDSSVAVLENPPSASPSDLRLLDGFPQNKLPAENVSRHKSEGQLDISQTGDYPESNDSDISDPVSLAEDSGTSVNTSPERFEVSQIKLQPPGRSNIIRIQPGPSVQGESWNRDILLYVGFENIDNQWKPATAQFDTGAPGNYISSEMINRLGLGTYKKKTKRIIGLSVDGKNVESQHQVSIHAKGVMDHDHHLYKFQVIKGLPVNIIFGRATINKQRFAIPNPESELCRQKTVQCTVLQLDDYDSDDMT